MQKGQTIGFLRRTSTPAIYHTRPNGRKREYKYEMYCDPDLGGCGRTVWMNARHIRPGSITQSCGCKFTANHVHNGLSTKDGKPHPLYGVWHSMIGRCYNPKATEYKNYGARSITVCDDWRYSFENYYHFAIFHGWSEGYDMDRFPDNDGNYQPCNVRFIPESEHMQTGTTRTNRNITAFGISQTTRKWYNDPRRHPDLTHRQLSHRLHKSSKWDPELAIISPPGPPARNA